MPSKPVPNGGAKAPPPRSPSKSTTRVPPTKLSTPVKAPSASQPTPLPVGDENATESLGPDANAVPTPGVKSIPENLETDSAGPSTTVEDLPASVVEQAPNDVAAVEDAAAAEEAERIRKLNGNGMVKLIYESYDELFPIEDGSTTQANIDEIYCLSFVMPNCLVRLSRHPNPERFQREESGIFDSLVREDPRGTYHDLEKDQTYYVVIEQEADQLRRDQEATKALWDGELQKQKKADKDDGRGFESCSCIYGNPCVDEYGCRDWHSRFAIATKNGWKGF
ncbi:hypothetical protein L917_00937 [Phytophthora nicotianae]|uniref:Uncharacterized protein n=2 Tax=Phytophthora nicotianae TaxID=4792 RepID=V9G048_PHYNI|nr:hypothetical protein F443_01046 [Phytophthora nicotianae P1569]ETM02611.1 hypothetical protein L917_00937 [Phytophthora nicotianae]ETM55861.1 hypothetical protein L914_00976 [Phytophthora nicotianae]